MKIKENRIELKNWYVFIDLSMSKITVTHKTDGRKWDFYSLEEVKEALGDEWEVCGG